MSNGAGPDGWSALAGRDARGQVRSLVLWDGT